MTVYWNRHRERWTYDFQVRGERHTGYCSDPETGQPVASKTDAKRIENQLRAAAERAIEVAPQHPAAMTLGTALAAHLTQHLDSRHAQNVRVYIRELRQFFGERSAVGDIDEARIGEYVTFAQAQPLMVYMGGGKRPGQHRGITPLWKPAKNGRTRSASTVNLYLDCLRASLRLASRLRHPVTRLPYLAMVPKVPTLKVPKRIPKPIRDGHLEAIISTAPPHLADAVVLTILMGFRKGEVFGLTIPKVDPDRCGVWLAAEETKGGKDEFIPASRPAMVLLLRLVEQAKAAGVQHLITYAHGRNAKPKPVKNPKRAWGTVMRKLGLNHRFHDTKASFVTELAARVPAQVVKALARHEDMATTQRYIDIVDQAKRDAVDQLADRRMVVGLDVADGLGSPVQNSRTTLVPLPKKKLSA